ncbi:sensor domain-containing diguanylate cyclase [Desulfomicrobium sp. ZS1]|uniref:sensor domain-containing diguanylate cyclase n=1 Tax=Desulfomicrobium sp. ZS1 TaxID=2952228 RepID=UPI0020B2EE36|nr:sensor domain-containing diguanylate cyclase [Desulfomicrobium sp. ZS1]UTF51845.1 sensor domain-containing diguanylate cyclase [Desulfomicrobium sp. ZS1]
MKQPPAHLLVDGEFQKKILDSVSEHIVVTDNAGVILLTNKGWDLFGRENGCRINNAWAGINYLEICEKAGKMGDEFGTAASEGIRQVIAGKACFQIEYPCHSPNEKRWFMMNANSFQYEGQTYLVIMHHNITQRKLAEEQALELARQDGLTGLFNRRAFDEFLQSEWFRCMRLNLPITVAMMDIDHFKILNDTYGHQQGDDCLIRLGNVIKKYARRPGDLCARYGGEEFVMVFGNSTSEQTLPLMHALMADIRTLDIKNQNAPKEKHVTLSIGLASTIPSGASNHHNLLKSADILLYQAKKNGRNNIMPETL